MTTTATTKPLSRLCTELRPLDILALSISSSSGQMRNIEVHTTERKRGYRFDPEARLFGVLASEMMTKCNYFPPEFSLVFTFLKEGVRNENEYLLSLLAPDRRTIILAVRLQRSTFIFDYFCGGQLVTASFNDKQINDGRWHTITVAVAGRFVSFTFDCSRRETFQGKMKKPFPPKLALHPGSKFHIASKRSRKNRFTGLLSQLYLVPGADISSSKCSSTSIFDKFINSIYSNKEDSTFVTFIDKKFQKETLSCDVSNQGQLVYRQSVGGLELCEGNRWNRIATTNERLDYISEFNDLTTKSKSLDVEVFRIPSHGLFLASANQGRGQNMNSTIFKWNGFGFEPYQNITTDNARHWKYFNIESEQFLVVANHGANQQTSEAQSKIYRWKEDQKRFVLHQYLTTFSARCFESFKINGKTFLVVANYAKNADYKAMSWIFSWEPDERAFIKYQPLETVGAYDFEYFRIGNEHYLALANSFNGVTTKLHSVIYRWMSSNFVPHQYIETVGASDIEHFQIDGVHYLAVANYYDHVAKSNQVNSTIYRFRERKRLFEKFQNIQTSGALDFEFFKVGRDSYLIVAVSEDSDKGLKNQIYRWQGVEGFVSVHDIPSHPCADWETFTTDDNKHYLVSANSQHRRSKILQIVTY